MNKETLEKGLQALQEAAEEGNPSARRGELFQKAQDGEITAEEHEELLKSLGGAGSIFADVDDNFSGNDPLQKSIDASDYLRESTDALVKSLHTICDRIEKSESKDQNFRIALAQTLTAQGDIIKSLCDAVDDMRGQTSRGPKSVGVNAVAKAAPLQKSFAGEAPTPYGMGREDILDAFEKAIHSNEQMFAGEDLVKAATKYESSNNISEGMLKALVDFTKQAA